MSCFAQRKEKYLTTSFHFFFNYWCNGAHRTNWSIKFCRPCEVVGKLIKIQNCISKFSIHRYISDIITKRTPNSSQDTWCSPSTGTWNVGVLRKKTGAKSKVDKTLTFVWPPWTRIHLKPLQDYAQARSCVTASHLGKQNACLDHIFVNVTSFCPEFKRRRLHTYCLGHLILEMIPWPWEVYTS